jgi:exodeoxyribonuclease V alpha subunit
MPAVVREIVTIRGELAAWRNIREGWGKGEVRTATGAIDFIGTLAGVRIGSSVEMTGSWEHHQTYGKQFRLTSCTVSTPESPEAIIKWLASTLPDVGDNRARKLVERFGKDLWRVIETAHEALATVEGITPARAEAIRVAYFKHKADRDNMIALRGWGLTDTQVARCVEEWGSLDEVIRQLRANPYELSKHVHGFGFKRADAVATKIGVRFDAPERIEAGVVYELEQASGSHGHCYSGAGALIRIVAEELLQVPHAAVEQGLREAIKAGLIVMHAGRPDAAGKVPRRVYLRALDRAEQICADKLAEMICP